MKDSDNLKNFKKKERFSDKYTDSDEENKQNISKEAFAIGEMLQVIANRLERLL